MSKRLTKFIILIVLILSAMYVLQRKQWLPSFPDLFKSGPVEIENSRILIKEINNLAQLITITAYNEIAIDSIKKGWALFNNPLIPTLLNIPNIKQAEQKLILVGKGRILAGIDLAKLTEGDIYIKKDSVSLKLPKAEILQVILNPSGFDIFDEKGKWTDDEVKAVKLKLKEKLIAHAMGQNILPKASARAILIMENFLSTAGFKQVTVTGTP